MRTGDSHLKHFLLFNKVVELRQVERQIIREQERAEEHTKWLKSQQAQELDKLSQELTVAIRERNLLMVCNFNFMVHSHHNLSLKILHVKN